MKFVRTLKSLILSASLLGVGSAHALIVVNGDFEAESLTLNSTGFVVHVPSGWSYSANDPIMFGSDYSPAHGSANLAVPFDLYAFQMELPGSVLAQSLSGLTTGQSYALTFQLSGYDTGPSGLTVGLSNTTTPTSTFVNTASAWSLQTVNFVANNSNVTLSFTSTGALNQSYPQLDNISVTAVPEVSEWAMMAAGLSVVGLMVRRRRA
jgi:Protein of unknown function (DUF642)